VRNYVDYVWNKELQGEIRIFILIVLSDKGKKPAGTNLRSLELSNLRESGKGGKNLTF